MVDLFCERVADYRAVVERCTEAEVTDRVLAALPPGRVVVPAGLSVDVPDALLDEGMSAAELDACAAVVTDATVGIAETGTIVLDHGPGQGRRAITLVPDVHVCIVRADQVVADVPDAMPRLDPAQPADLDQRPQRHQRHRAQPGRGRARPPHPARPRRRLNRVVCLNQPDVIRSGCHGDRFV